MEPLSPPVFAAIDLGASSGRVVAGVIRNGDVELRTMHRFPNAPREQGGHLRWNLTALFDEVLTGLARLAREFGHVTSVGVDTWGVDYGLLDAGGRLLAEPVAYRDGRTTALVDAVHERVGRDELYRITGVQFLPFNTIYQLAAEQRGEPWAEAAHIVLLPDLIAYWLTGELRTEATNASTTGLLDVRSGNWSAELLGRLDISPARLPPIEQPGSVRGRIRPELCARLGLDPSTDVITVGSHDTASAVVGVPATARPCAFVSSGTWSLVGCELDAPVMTAQARDANFTNERGVDGRIRFLRNTGGLWLLQESLRSWAEAGRTFDVASLLEEAAALPDEGRRVDVDDPLFVAPGDMPARIAAAAGSRELTPAATARCIVDSLAAAFARTVHAAVALAGVDVAVVHLVGGGSRSDLLCRRTADGAGLPVVAGPVEATALGNVLVQARARGVMPASLDEMRAAMARSPGLRRYELSGTLIP
ncbi:MAG TPA: rhamnulokinase family protein [Acidimicrobiia bacterium]|nr:rhamnulokinase family protein [Acidimicrobiia bacterium]